ncbi:hypothetical protein [Beijerinckia sp. L45]|uniref:hypothetical protein n=1 Tax=Beijerinckia sp. L45 TaxID=1641855 RepID=UPI00131C829A|nr:hypothetical protein [Beijerinckia sp. L45]
MRIIWVVVGALIGLIVGAAVGFGVALAAMSAGPQRSDGTYGMREMLVCLPAGILFGLAAGLWWGLTTTLAAG